MKIFVDADWFISVNFKDHPNYKNSIKLLKQAEKTSAELITCTYAVVEAATVISKYFSKEFAPVFAKKILYESNMQIIKGDLHLQDGIETLEKQNSKNISLNDCVHFSICKKLKITEVLSYDKHWIKNGFKFYTKK